MLYNRIQELLKEKAIWVIMDIGWHRLFPLSVCFTEEQAIAEWETLVNKKYTKESYQEYTQVKNANYEGHWHYEIRKMPMTNVLAIMEQRVADFTIEKEAEKIQKAAMKKARHQTQKELQEIINGMLYYLSENDFDTDVDYDKQRNSFWEKIKNCRK